LILKPESKYFVEGWTDNLRIAVECNHLLVRATDNGFMLCSTDEWCFPG
jgi:hypothetical protein